MSVNSIQSDYTPKDFLAKLLSKSSSNDSTLPDQQYSSSNVSIGQLAVLGDKSLRIISPKSASIKRIQFQSVRSIHSPRKQDKQNEQTIIQHKKTIEFNQNLRKKSLKKQIDQVNASPQYPNPYHLIKQTSEQKSQVSIKEQDLMLKKTQFFLKSALRNKISNQQMENLISQLRKGFQNSSQFDKITQQASINSQPEIQQTKFSINRKQMRIQKQKVHSKSVCLNKRVIKEQGPQERRAKSQMKALRVNKTKKQKKQKIIESKQIILKQVKKIKQLVFLNEKGLRLTRKISMN